MSGLSSNALQALAIAIGAKDAANEVASVINRSATSQANASMTMPAAIVAAHVSATTDFAALAVGDLLVHIPASAGNCSFEVVATAGTKPSAAVVGDLYIVIRAKSEAAAVSVVL